MILDILVKFLLESSELYPVSAPSVNCTKLNIVFTAELAERAE